MKFKFFLTLSFINSFFLSSCIKNDISNERSIIYHTIIGSSDTVIGISGEDVAETKVLISATNKREKTSDLDYMTISIPYYGTRFEGRSQSANVRTTIEALSVTGFSNDDINFFGKNNSTSKIDRSLTRASKGYSIRFRSLRTTIGQRILDSGDDLGIFVIIGSDISNIVPKDSIVDHEVVMEEYTQHIEVENKLEEMISGTVIGTNNPEMLIIKNIGTECKYIGFGFLAQSQCKNVKVIMRMSCIFCRTKGYMDLLKIPHNVDINKNDHEPNYEPNYSISCLPMIGMCFNISDSLSIGAGFELMKKNIVDIFSKNRSVGKLNIGSSGNNRIRSLSRCEKLFTVFIGCIF